MAYNPFERGSLPVGVRTLTMRDEARGGRELTVEVWYPAAESFRGRDLNEASSDAYTIVPALPVLRQQAVRDASPAAGRFPLVAHCHGANGDRRDKTYLCTHLASHGYVVASPDFPGDTIADMVRDEQSETGRRSTMSIDELANYRPDDAAFVVEQLIAGADPWLAGCIDGDRVGACGHSYGGWTSLALNSVSQRSRATFAMAPLWGSRSPLAQLRRVGPRLRLDDWGRPVPTFLLAAELDNCVMLDDLRELAVLLPKPSRFAVMPRAGHMHFVDHAERVHELMRSIWASPSFPDTENDGPALARAARPFSELMPERHAHDTVRGLCLAHMDAHVRDLIEARTFLAGDLNAAFKARGIALDVAPPQLV